MNIFASDNASYDNSLQVLNLIANYDDFMGSIETICDMGCGSGYDLNWWATKTYIDDSGIDTPYNYKCIGIDLDVSRIHNPPSNVTLIQGDFEERQLDTKVDLMWSHDAFRYATNPLATLKLWNEQLNENGMIAITVPQTIHVAYNKLTVRSLPLNYYHYSITNLLYMLAVNGFDCYDGQFVRMPGEPWIHCVAYKSDIAPMNPKTTTWYELADKKLLPQTAINCISTYGFLKQEELQTHWLDGQFCNWNRL